ncbi:hypothetical protein Aperf_G00000054030 [Anoplocephala perfoliata]
MMDSVSFFDASCYEQFPNYPQMELDYMRFLSKGANIMPTKEQCGNLHVVKEIQKNTWGSRMESLEALVKQMALRVDELEGQIKRLGSIFPSELPKDAKPVKRPAAPVKPELATEEGNDDFDLFGSEDEDDAKPRHVPVVAKPKKEGPVAKSLIVLDVKPWDDTTDMAELEANVRKITADGLVWGTGKLVPLAYGIQKLQIACVVEDDKIGSDFLEENITALSDYVQSVDIASFNKL